MKNQAIVLTRPRETLRQPAEGLAQEEAGPWAVPASETLRERIGRFARNAESLRAEFKVCANLVDALTHLRGFGWNQIGTHNGALTGAVAAALDLPTVNTSGRDSVEELETCDAGVTECEALIAQTATVVVSAADSGGRALSTLPPHHVVLARQGQLAPDLAAAFVLLEKKYKNNWPSTLSFITGPSRTGEIEGLRALGAQGPKKLTILLLPDP